MDKVIVAEDMPIYGMTKVRHTSKFQGAALARGIRELGYMPVGRQGYVRYEGKITHATPAWIDAHKKQAEKHGTIAVKHYKNV